MTTQSQQGVELLAGFEGFEANAYQDQGGVWTVGYGCTRIDGRPVRKGDTVTREQAMAMLQADAAAAGAEINRLVRVALTQNQFDALVSLVYNIGGGNFSTSTLLKRLNACDYLGAAAQFTEWSHIKGVFNKGLFTRRIAERDYFTKPA